MIAMSVQQLRDAAKSLGLKRADIAHIFGYSWGQVDKWWVGSSRIPAPVCLMFTLWMHPQFPPGMRPRTGIPYVLELPNASDKYFSRELPPLP